MAELDPNGPFTDRSLKTGGLFTDPDRPLYHGERSDTVIEMTMRELIRVTTFEGDTIERELPPEHLELRALVDWGESGLFWDSVHNRITRALYAALFGTDSPLRFDGDNYCKQQKWHPKAVERLAEILPATRGKNAGKVGITEKSARILLDNPEKLSSEQVRAVMDATGVSLEFLRGKTLERTATATHGGASELAAIYDALSDSGKDTLWSVATALASREQNALT